ncbi:MAG: hypothetical protein Q9218_004055 [Villophora microphyllina]
MAAEQDVIVTLTPSNNDHDFPRAITLSPTNDTITIGRASKTASKGLFAASNNAWFDCPIMSREHAKLSVTYDETTFDVHLQDMGSTHGTWLGPRRLAPYEKCTLRTTGDLVTFGTTVMSGPVTYDARSFSVMLSRMLDDQEAVAGASSSPTAPTSGYHVPDDDIDSISIASEASSCQIVDSHPRTFSVPSSGDEMDQSDDDIVISARRRSRALRNAIHTNVRSPSPELGQSTNQPYGQESLSRKESQAGSAVDPIEVEEAIAVSDEDSGDESGEEELLLQAASELSKPTGETKLSASHYEAATRLSPQIPDTYAELRSLPHEWEWNNSSLYCEPANGKQNPDEDEDTRVQCGQPDSDQHHVHHVAPYLPHQTHTSEPPKDSHSDPLDPCVRAAARQVPCIDSYQGQDGQETADFLFPPPSPSICRSLSPIANPHAAHVESDQEDSAEDDLDAVCPQDTKAHPELRPTPHTQKPYLTIVDAEKPYFTTVCPVQGAANSSLDVQPPKFSSSCWPLPPARAPSPSDAALARKASAGSGHNHRSVAATDHFREFFDNSSRSYRPVGANLRQNPAVQDTNGWPYKKPIVDAPWHSTPYAFPTPYNPSVVPALNNARLPSVQPDGDDYKEGPFSRNYPSFHSVAVPPSTRNRSESPVMQKKCILKFKYDKAGKPVLREKRNIKFPSLKLGGLKKPTKVEISDLINPHAEGSRGLKRKLDQIGSEPIGVVPQPSVAPSNQDVAIAQEVEACSIKLAAQEQSQPIAGPTSFVVDSIEEGPARKKAKVSSSKAGTIGKLVSGVCLGLFGAFSAFVYSTPAEVWEEALREAMKLQ